MNCEHESHGADVEDCTGEEEREELEETLNHLNLLDNKVKDFLLQTAWGIIICFLLICFLLESDQGGGNLEEKEEAARNRQELRVEMTPPGGEAKK